MSLEYEQSEKYSTFTDYRDGKVYKTVKIGSQIWMAENLAYSIGGRYYNDKHTYGKKYHLLYDWHSAMIACPSGWHLPSQREWNTLIDFVGGEKVAGEKLKAKSGWNDNKGNSCNGTDDFGFAALPGGFGKLRVRYDDLFQDAGSDGYWWSSTESDAWRAYNRYIYLYSKEVDSALSNKRSKMFSVRCVRNF